MASDEQRAQTVRYASIAERLGTLYNFLDQALASKDFTWAKEIAAEITELEFVKAINDTVASWEQQSPTTQNTKHWGQA